MLLQYRYLYVKKYPTQRTKVKNKKNLRNNEWHEMGDLSLFRWMTDEDYKRLQIGLQISSVVVRVVDLNLNIFFSSRSATLLSQNPTE
jgi:hypothetical protein